MNIKIDKNIINSAEFLKIEAFTVERIFKLIKNSNLPNKNQVINAILDGMKKEVEDYERNGY